MNKINITRLTLIAALCATAAVQCEDYATKGDEPYFPPMVKGDDGRRFLWAPQPGERQCYEPSFSPNGKKVAVSYRHGRWGRDGELAILDLTSGDLDIVLGDNGVKCPAWSPSGEWLAYQSSEPSTPPYIWVVRADGSANHRVDVDWAYTPKWGADDHTLFFTCAGIYPRNDVVVKYDLVTSELTVLYKSEYLYNCAGYVRPGPGAEKVAFRTVNDITHEGVICSLAFMDADGANLRVEWQPEEPAFGFPECWSPDGKYLVLNYYNPMADDMQYYCYEVKTRRASLLTMSKPGADPHGYYGASWGPHGDVVFATDEGWLYLLKAPE